MGAHSNLGLQSRFFANQPQPLSRLFSYPFTLSFYSTICTPAMLNSSTLNEHALLLYSHTSFTDWLLYLKCLPSTPSLPGANSLSFKTYLMSPPHGSLLRVSLTVSHTFLYPSIALCTCLCYTTHYSISELWASSSPTRPQEEFTPCTSLFLQHFTWAEVMKEI